MGKHPNSRNGFKKGENKGKENINWKGESTKYRGKHMWVSRQKGKASNYFCVDCSKKAREWSNVDHEYKRIIEDYFPRCKKCHIIYDKKHNDK